MSTAVIGYMPMPVNFEYRSLFLHGRPKHEKFDDFWRKHPPMDRTHRAKIFSAFDALAGFDGWIASKEVRYCDRRYLSEEEHDNLDRKLSVLRGLTRNSKEVRRNKPVVTVQYFSPCTDRNSFLTEPAVSTKPYPGSAGRLMMLPVRLPSEKLLSHLMISRMLRAPCSAA